MHVCVHHSLSLRFRDIYAHAHANFISPTTKPLPDSTANTDYDTLCVDMHAHVGVHTFRHDRMHVVPYQCKTNHVRMYAHVYAHMCMRM